MKSIVRVIKVAAIIIVIGIGILKLYDYKEYKFWYVIKKYVINKHDAIDKMYLSYNGPYGKIEVRTKKTIDFEEAEKIFIDIASSCDGSEFKKDFVEKHLDIINGEMPFFKINFRLSDKIGYTYSFMSTSKDDYRVWTYYEGQYQLETPIRYDIEKYMK